MNFLQINEHGTYLDINNVCGWGCQPGEGHFALGTLSIEDQNTLIEQPPKYNFETGNQWTVKSWRNFTIR